MALWRRDRDECPYVPGELIHHSDASSQYTSFKPAEQPVELASAEWIDWYCHRRLHSEIGHVPPVEYETNYYTELTEPEVKTTI